MNLKLASIAMESAELQNATQIACLDMSKPKISDKARKGVARRIEKAASRLTDAAELLETLLDSRQIGLATSDDVHEALAHIMETQQLVAAACNRLRREEGTA